MMMHLLQEICFGIDEYCVGWWWRHSSSCVPMMHHGNDCRHLDESDEMAVERGEDGDCAAVLESPLLVGKWVTSRQALGRLLLPIGT